MSNPSGLSRFMMDHPATARSHLVTAQMALSSALCRVSQALGACDVATRDAMESGVPTERLTWAMGSVEEAVGQMLRAAKALEALRSAGGPSRTCMCDAYDAIHAPGVGNCLMRQK